MKLYNNINIFFAVLGLMVSLSFNSCTDFLEKDLSGQVVAGQFFQTEEDLKASAVAVIAPLTTGNINKRIGAKWLVPLMGGDDLTTRKDDNKDPWRQTDQFNCQPTNQWFYPSSWDAYYKSIYAANTVLDNYQNMNISESVKLKFAGVASFFRANSYFRLVRIFGAVPMPIQAEPDYTMSRTPVADVYDQIVADAKFAEENLPDEWPGEPGFPTKWAAKTLLADVYLTMAGWPLKQESYYALARDKAKEVLGKYSLMENFGDFFNIVNNNNKETIFAYQFSYTVGGVNYGNVLGGGFGNPPEDSGFADYCAELSFFRKFPEGPRKDATYYTKTSNGTPYTEWSGTFFHPTFAKFRSGYLTNGDGAHRNVSDRCIAIYRYPHILTIYAEAQVMADGSPNTEAYDCINQIRRRAGLSNLIPGLSQIAFRDSVVQEKAWEFAGEFCRWFDLVRLEKVAEANADKDPAELQPERDINSLPKEYYYWLPLPKADLDLNPNLIQNEGY